MAKGGYKGNPPARETSPEEYSGVWDIVEQYGEQKTGSWPFQADDCAPKSLRFNEGSASNLTKTFAIAGNRRVFTWNFWVKVATLSENNIVVVGSGSSNSIRFNTDGTLQIKACGGNLTTSAVFRDFSAWYGITVVVNSTVSVATDRIKLFVNGEDFTSNLTGTSATLNGEADWNTAATHYIGKQEHNSSNMLDGLLSEVTFIDGQALSCEEFGFFDGQGIWQPKRFTGDYSSGPVYSNAVPTADGFRSGRLPHHGFDGDLTTYIALNNTTFNLDVGSWGLSGTLEVYTGSNHQYAVNGGSASNMTASGWTNVGNASSITTLTLTRTDGNYPYFNAIRLNGVILTDPIVGRNSFHLDFSDGVKDQSGLGNDWTGNNVDIFSGSPESRVWESGDSGWTIASGGGSATEGGGNGYQDVFTGLMEVGKVYAFTTSHTSGDQNGGWFFADSNSTSLSGTHPNQGRGTNSIGQRGRSSGHNDEDKAGAHGTFATANGVTAGDSNLSGFSIINPEGSDTINWVVDRVKHKVWVKRSTDSAWIQGGNPSNGGSAPSFHLPATGNLYFGFVQYNNNNFTISIASYSVTVDRSDDLFVDSPVNSYEPSTGAGGERRGNYCTLNPLDHQSNNGTLSNGNLDLTQTAGAWAMYRSTIFVSSGKWYWECTLGNDQYSTIGICTDEYNIGSATNAWVNHSSEMFGYYPYNGYKYNGGSGASYATADTSASGSVIGVALDMDNGTLAFYKDGTSLGTAYTGLTGKNVSPTHWLYNQSNADSYNFGQQAFSHNAPSGFSPLATSFLSEPSEVAMFPHKGVDVALFNANNGVSQSIPLSFSPDLVWTKSRAQSYEPQIFDKVRGNDQEMSTNVARASRNLAGSFTFNDDGFTLPGSNNNANYGGGASVAWAWDAGEATTNIAAGGLNTSAYETSQTWSDNITTTGNSGSWSTSSSFAVTNAFNGDDSSYAHANPDGSSACVVTLSISPAISCNSTVTFLGGVTSSGNGTISINGGTATAFSTVGTNPTAANTVTVPFSGNISSVVITKTSTGANGVLIYGFEIDGKRLIDNGVSVTNVPSIATTVRANPSYGFSISRASVLATLSGGPTVAHGLQKKPEFIIGKNIDYTIYWYAYHKDLTENHYLIPHRTEGEQNSGAVWGSHDSLDANKIQIGSGTPASMWIPSGTDDCIFYAWTSIEGFSKFGSFMNPSSSNGAFVYLGFKPALIMAKCAKNVSSSSSAGDWIVKDSSRSSFNNPSDGNTLVWNEEESEDGYYQASQAAIDILSNGFKIRHPNSSPLGDPGRVYVYAAWAENPFASNNRAV